VPSRRVRVDVTAEDIAQGRPTSSESCAIALATRRAINTDRAAYFGVGSSAVVVVAKVGGHSERYVILLPDKATRFVLRFDAGERIEPFSFEIEIPSELAGLVRTPDPPQEGVTL